MELPEATLYWPIEIIAKITCMIRASNREKAGKYGLSGQFFLAQLKVHQSIPFHITNFDEVLIIRL